MTGNLVNAETHSYNSRERVVWSFKTGNTVTDAITYGDDGNILSRTGMGNYAYLGAQPHAVTRVDNTGHLIASTSQQVAYNKYSRLQKESEEMAVKAEKSKWMSRLWFVLFILIIAVSTYLFVLYKKKQKEEIEKLGVSYTNLMSKYRQVCNEVESLKTDKDEALRDKEKEMAQVKSQLDGTKKLYDALSPDLKKLPLEIMNY